MLTASDRKRREGKLTASRVACIMTGDKAKIHRLWEELTGQREEEDLSRIFQVRLGAVTEKLQCDWYEESTGIAITRRGEIIVHPKMPWAAATIDGWETDINGPFEAKHVGGHEPSDIIRDRYYPQLQWQMWVSNAKRACLSIIMGTSDPIREFLELDEAFVGEMVSRAWVFMTHVINKTPPVDMTDKPIAFEATKTVDMTGNNEWGSHAAVYLETREAYQRHDKVKLELRKMIPGDVRKAHGHGVVVTRDRRGVASVRAERENGD